LLDRYSPLTTTTDCTVPHSRRFFLSGETAHLCRYLQPGNVIRSVVLIYMQKQLRCADGVASCHINRQIGLCLGHRQRIISLCQLPNRSSEALQNGACVGRHIGTALRCAFNIYTHVVASAGLDSTGTHEQCNVQEHI
jgi:hypothetical protein